MKVSRVFAIALAMAWVSARLSAEPTSFRFLHITDTHVAAGKNVEPIATLLRRESAISPSAAFIVNTGDVTELGYESEFDAYLKVAGAFPFTVYAVPGNHDVRWAPLGKEAFRRACGPLHRSFDYGGCHFVLLDSTVVLEHWGHFDGAQLTWLAADLRRLKRGTPVFLFFHHPFGRERTNIDNAGDLLDIIAPHNVVAAFMGHGHSDLHWKVNGIECFMAKGLYQGSYHEIEVSQGVATVRRRVLSGSEWTSKTLVEIPMSRPASPRLRIKWEDAGHPILDRRRFRVEMTPTAGITGPLAAKWSVRGSPLGGSMSPVGRGLLSAEIEAAELGAGWHTLEVTVDAGPGRTITLEEPFRRDRADAVIREAWDYLTKSTIQGSPTLVGDHVYVGSFDGSVYALDARTGRIIWKRPTGGSIFSTPVVVGDALLIGSMDQNLYCLDRRSGKVRWKFDTGAPIFASAAVSDGVACVGGNRAIYGVTMADGKLAWSVPTGSFFQSRAATAGGLFVLGGWDNAVYAIRAVSGEVAWKHEMGRTQGGTGRLSFYYSPAIASPTISNDRAYICTNDGLLHCLQLTDGRELWAVRAPSGSDTFGYSSPLVYAGKVFLGGLGESGRGNCYAIDADTGHLIWKARTGADNYDSSPALTGPWIAIGSVEGKITWLDPASGAIVAQYAPRPGYSFSTPAGDASLTYTASMNGRITALTTPRTTGKDPSGG